MSFSPVYTEAAMGNDNLEYIYVLVKLKNSGYFFTAEYALDYVFCSFHLQLVIRLDKFTTEMTKGCHHCYHLAGN